MNLVLKSVAELLAEDYGEAKRTYPDPSKRPTWSQLVRHEPRLTELRRSVEQVRDRGRSSFCANKVWYASGGPKAQLVRLVGWESEVDHPALRNSVAYDVAYKALYALLPDCRNCFCFAPEKSA